MATDNLDGRVGAVVAVDSGVEYRQVLGHAEESEQYLTPDKRHWIAVRDVIPDHHLQRDPSGVILRSPFTIHWKEDGNFRPNNFYRLPAPFEPIPVGDWERIGGERLATLTGPRLRALGLRLFPDAPPPIPPPNRTLRNLVTDCAEPTICNYILAIRNPHCFDPIHVKIINDSVAAAIPCGASKHFAFSCLPGKEPGSVLLDEIISAMEDAWKKYAEWEFPPPSVEASEVIPVLLVDMGSFRGDSVPHAAIRLNLKYLTENDQTRRALCAHELFHRVQYRYGFHTLEPNLRIDLPAPSFPLSVPDPKGLSYVERATFKFALEGMASFVEYLVTGTVTTAAKVQALRSHPEMGLFEISYAAFVFWYAFADGEVTNIREILKKYTETSTPRADPIRQAFKDYGGDAFIALTIRNALVIPLNVANPDGSGDLVTTRLRVTPVDVPADGSPVQVDGVVQLFGTDVFLVGPGVAARVAGENVQVTPQSDERGLVYVQGFLGGRSLTYSLLLAKGVIPDPTPPGPPTPPPPDPLPFPELEGHNATVSLDQFGNVLVHLNQHSDIALGFQLNVPIRGRAELQRVYSSLSNYDPLNPGLGNREFQPGEFSNDGRKVMLIPTLLTTDRGPGVVSVSSVEREVSVQEIAGVGVTIKIKTAVILDSPVGVDFAFLSVSAAAGKLKDGDGGEDPGCDFSARHDCDPETGPLILIDPPGEPDYQALTPFHLKPGCVVAPFRRSSPIPPSGPGGTAGVFYLQEFTHSHVLERFIPLDPPCP